jgi:hypothetical protein
LVKHQRLFGSIAQPFAAQKPKVVEGQNIRVIEAFSLLPTATAFPVNRGYFSMEVNGRASNE